MRTAALVALVSLLAACSRPGPASGPPSAHSSPQSAPQAPDEHAVSLERLAPGVWMHTSWRDLPQVGWFVSHGLVVEAGADLLLIDTAWGVEPTRELLSLVKQRLGKLPRAAIVTHAHDDRVGGLPVLREHGVVVHGTAATGALVEAQGLGKLDVTLDAPIAERALGGVRVEVFSPGPAHTSDNAVVYLPAQKLLFGGCMIRPAGARALGNLADADLSSWASSALRVEQRYREADIVVPSHGPPGDRALLSLTTSLAHDALAGAKALTRASQLPVRDGAEVTVCGAYEVVEGLPGPGGAPRRAALRLEGETKPQLFVSPAQDGLRPAQPVCIRGRFSQQYPLPPGDPPHAARFSGWWLTDARAAQAADAPR